MSRFEKGKIVYVNSPYLTADKCEITDFIRNESGTGKPVYKLKSFYLHGEYAAIENCIFPTEKKAQDAYREECEKLVQTYLEEIKTVEDLIRFPLNHCLMGEEKDYEAEQAYKIRAYALTKLSL